MEFKRELVSLKSLAFCAFTEPDADCGLSLFHRACILGHLETVQLVLYCSPSKVDNAVALCLRVQNHAQLFAGRSPQSIAHSLHTANHERIADLLDATREPWQRRSLLREIVSKGNTAQLKRLVRSETNFDWRDVVKYRIDRSGTTLLMSACIRNNSKMAEFLIGEGARVHARDQSHKTALHLAASNNSLDAIEVLLRNGSTINDGDANGLAALHHATQNGHYETAARLVEKGCNLVQTASSWRSVPISDECRWAGFSPLHFASQNGHPRIVELLVRKGVDVDCKTAKGCTPLMLASQDGHLEVVRLLLHLGSDVGELDCSSYSALQYAARNTRPDVAKLLIDSGVEVTRHVHTKDMEKLLVSATKERKPELLEVLLQHGYSSSLSLRYSCNGVTLLHQAANVTGNADVVRVLLRHGADIQARDKHGMTALHHAADTQIAALLLASGCDLNATDKWGEVAPFHAARSQRYKLVQYFLRQGCEIESLSMHGFSLFQLLLTLGAPLPNGAI